MTHFHLKYTNRFIPFLIFGMVLFVAANVKAQRVSSDSSTTTSIQPIQKGTKIWTGTAGVNRQTFFEPEVEGFEKEVQTRLDIAFQYLRSTHRDFSWGISVQTELFMSGTFGNLALGKAAVGPLLRGYPWQNERWQSYLQFGFLIGYDLALADAVGANRSEGVRVRPGLRAGLTYRVSNSFGIFLETGPDWEANQSFEFDSRSWQLNVGIQLFRF